MSTFNLDAMDSTIGRFAQLSKIYTLMRQYDTEHRDNSDHQVFAEKAASGKSEDAWSQLKEEAAKHKKDLEEGAKPAESTSGESSSSAITDSCNPSLATDSSDSVKSASPPPPAPPAEVVDLDSDATIVEVVEAERPSSPSLLDGPATLSPLKRALDEASQDYAITTPKPQAPRTRTARPNIRYLEYFYSLETQKDILEELLTYPFEPITFNVHGRTFTPKRKVLAFADSGVSYSFSGVSLQPKPWTPLMQSIKKKVEDEMGFEYNHALLNFYGDGTAKLSCHKDNENCMDTSVPVLTLSFGAQRNMQFVKKGESSIIQPLHPRSLLVMYDQQWNHGVMADYCIKSASVSISFQKLTVPSTVQLPWQPPFSGQVDVQPAQDMADPGFLDSFPYAQPLLSEESVEPPAKKACLDPALHIPEDDWLTRHCQGVAESTDMTARNYVPPQNTDVCKFWLSDAVALSVQIFRGELCVHIREYYVDTNDHYETLPTKRGATFNMYTFFDFCRKLPNFSKTLLHNDESCILNNCVLVVIEDCEMHIWQFNSTMLHPNEIVLSVDMFQSLQSQLEAIINFILDYQYNTLLKSQLCLPIQKLPYMDESFRQLKNMVEYNVRDGIHFAFKCPECVTGREDMYFHECRRLRYSEKFRQLPRYLPMIVNVKEIAEEYLGCNSKLNFADYDFTKLYKNVY